MCSSQPEVNRTAHKCFFCQAQNAALEAQANTELDERIKNLEQEVVHHKEDSGKAQAEVDRLLDILREMENEKNDKDKKINELERWVDLHVAMQQSVEVRHFSLLVVSGSLARCNYFVNVDSVPSPSCFRVVSSLQCLLNICSILLAQTGDHQSVTSCHVASGVLWGCLAL